MPVTKVKSHWASGQLHFEAAAGGMVRFDNSTVTAGDDYGTLRAYATAAAPSNAYGVAGYFDTTLSGTVAGHTYGFGSWINFSGTVVGGGYHICAQDNGIYGTVTATGTSIIFGMKMEAIITGTPTVFAPFYLGTSNKAITALFSIASAPAIGLVSAVASTATACVGSVPLFVDGDGTDVRYVHVYDVTT